MMAIQPTPKIFINPRIKQSAMALWSIAVSLDFEKLASVKRCDRSKWSDVL
jgi:hypothetical protein